MTARSTRGGFTVWHTVTLDFVLDPSQDKAQHGLYVRHPDILSCRIGGTIVEDLTLTAISPDRSIVAGGRNNETGPFATVADSHAGQNDLWGLEVAWPPMSPRKAPVAYSLSCESGTERAWPTPLSSRPGLDGSAFRVAAVR